MSIQTLVFKFELKTKINNTFRTAEFLLPEYNGEIRKDKHYGGGVMIENDYDVEYLDIVHVEAETV